MSKFWNSHNQFVGVYAEAGDTGGGGGSLLTGNSNGGGATDVQGGTTTLDGTAAQTSSAGTGTTHSGSNGNAPTDWKTVLPAEFREDPSLKTIPDVGTLAKSYIHAQRLVGTDKISIPSKHATPDDWRQVYNKLGLPADIKDYSLKLDDTTFVDKTFTEQFKKTAFESGVLPHQAQKLADWFQGINAQSEQTMSKMHADKMAADLKGLESEWGAAYKQNIAKAGTALREINDPELNKYLDSTGLGNDPKVIKMFAAIADKYMKEDVVIGSAEGAKVFTPDQAKREANGIMADFNHPYHQKDHPNHAAAVKEVAGLFEMASRR